MDWQNPIATRLLPTAEIKNRAEKEVIAAEIARRARSGEVIGIGSGSTALLALIALAERVRQEGLEVLAIPTSHEIELASAALGLPTTGLMTRAPDWCFDGADEVDRANNLIKGRGGAFFREKLVISAAGRVYILADRSKLVERLGGLFPVPVEVVPEAVHLAERGLAALGAAGIELRLAKGKDGPVITEQGNFILDARFDPVTEGLEGEIKRLPGVLDSGLFQGYALEVLSG